MDVRAVASKDEAMRKIEDLVVAGFQGHAYFQTDLLLRGDNGLRVADHAQTIDAKSPSFFKRRAHERSQREGAARAPATTGEPATTATPALPVRADHVQVVARSGEAEELIRKAHADACDMLQTVSQRTIDLAVKQFEVMNASISDGLFLLAKDRLEMAQAGSIAKRLDNVKAIAERAGASDGVAPPNTQTVSNLPTVPDEWERARARSTQHNPQQPSLWARALRNLYYAFQS